MDDKKRQEDNKKELKEAWSKLLLKYHLNLLNLKNTILSNTVRLKYKSLHKKIKSHFKLQNLQWKTPIYPCYQGYKRIALSGLRPTEERLKAYGLNKYLNDGFTVLDIGCNSGFISLETSYFVKSVDGLDVNPFLINVAKDTKDFLEIKNANFYCTGFEDYHTDKIYDIIFSFANHETWDGNSKYLLDEYLKKIWSLLSEDGKLFFETHDIRKENITQIKENLDKFFITEEDFFYSRIHPAMVDRKFYILKKRLNLENI